MPDISSIGGVGQFSASQRHLDDGLRQVASGSRLSSPGGSAAEVAIATVLSSEDVLLGQTAINAAQGASVAQVADGGLSQIEAGLRRLRELAASAGNGGLNDASRSAIDREARHIRDEITSIAEDTRFNGQNLLDQAGTLDFLVGIGAGDTVSVDTVDATATSLGIGAIDLSTAGGASTALAAVDLALDTVAVARTGIGAAIERFQFRLDNIIGQQDALAGASSALADSDLGAALAQTVSAGILFEGEAFAASQANKSAQQLLSVLR